MENNIITITKKYDRINKEKNNILFIKEIVFKKICGLSHKTISKIFSGISKQKFIFPMNFETYRYVEEFDCFVDDENCGNTNDDFDFRIESYDLKNPVIQIISITDFGKLFI
jgi:hypothetical protein